MRSGVWTLVEPTGLQKPEDLLFRLQVLFTPTAVGGRPSRFTTGADFGAPLLSESAGIDQENLPFRTASSFPVAHLSNFATFRLRLARTLAPSMISRPQQSATNQKLRVLGVDPAVAGAIGYGVIQTEGSRATCMRFGALKLPRQLTFAFRLREIHLLITSLVEQFRPDAVAVESVFTSLNMRTALKLAEMRGVVLLAAAQAQIPAHSYSPREIKASVAGFGAASKQQIQQMVRSLLDMDVIPEPADASDALAVALCHAQLSRARERLARSTARATARPAGASDRAAASANRAVQFPD
ncbi:MAG: crossover junction endodeoxyribonuclease RuvC [Candidatus Acidiferrales bacterium]